MKLRSARYLTVEGFKNIWVNRLMSIASIGVLVACMLLIGVAIIFTKNVDKAMGALEKQNVVMAFFEDTLPDQDAESTCNTISELDNVAAVEFIPKETGLNNQLANMDSAQAEYFRSMLQGGENPLPNAAKITLSDLSRFDETITQIKAISGVSHINEQRELAMKINSIKQSISVAGFWIIGMLLVIALVIVANTIRVTMYNRKLEISIMKAVGATNSFVRFPFVVEGMVLGLVSALFTSGLLYLVYRLALDTIQKALSIDPVPYRSFAGELFLLFAGIGVLTGLFSSFVMISRYLRKEGSEFRAF